MVNGRDDFLEIEPKDRGTELAEEMIRGSKKRKEKEEEEKELKFKGKVIEIKPSGRIVIEKPKKLTKKELRSLEKKIRGLEKEKKLLKRKNLFSKLGRRKGFKPQKPKTLRGLRLRRGIETRISPLEIREARFIKDTTVPSISPMLNEFDKAIRDVRNAALPTLRDGFNQSVFVENSALTTLRQSDREIQLIKDLLGGRL